MLYTYSKSPFALTHEVPRCRTTQNLCEMYVLPFSLTIQSLNFATVLGFPQAAVRSSLARQKEAALIVMKQLFWILIPRWRHICWSKTFFGQEDCMMFHNIHLLDLANNLTVLVPSIQCSLQTNLIHYCEKQRMFVEIKVFLLLVRRKWVSSENVMHRKCIQEYAR